MRRRGQRDEGLTVTEKNGSMHMEKMGGLGEGKRMTGKWVDGILKASR